MLQNLPHRNETHSRKRHLNNIRKTPKNSKKNLKKNVQCRKIQQSIETKMHTKTKTRNFFLPRIF